MYFRERPIRGLMPMSDEPMLAWLNQPLPITYWYRCLRPVSNLSYTMHAHEICRKTQRVQGWNRFCLRMSSVLSAISLPHKLPWNLKPYTVYHCRSHFREARSVDCDETIREKHWHGPSDSCGWNAGLKVFLRGANLKFLAMGMWSQTQYAGRDAG